MAAIAVFGHCWSLSIDIKKETLPIFGVNFYFSVPEVEIEQPMSSDSRFF